MKIQNNIRRKILVSLVLVTIVGAASIYVTHYARKISEQDCWKTIQFETKEIDRQLNEYFTSVKNSIAGQVNMFLSEPNLKNPDLYKRMFVQLSKNLDNHLRLYLPDGYAILEDGIHEDISNLVKYQDIESIRPYMSEPHENILKPGQFVIEHFEPVRSRGKVIGMFASAIEIEKLQERIKISSYEGNANYTFTDRIRGKVFLDTAKNNSWFIKDEPERDSKKGYSYRKWQNSIQLGLEDVCIYKDENKKTIYSYTIPSQVADWNISLFVEEKYAMEKLHRISGVLWNVFVIELLTFFIYIVWTIYDSSYQIKILRAQAEEKARAEATEAQREKLEKQQEALEQALKMAQSANRAKTTFLNNMSHDIRTPMNAIIGYTNLALLHLENTEKIQDYLKKIGKSSEHLLSLINDVLDMSRIESGKLTIVENNENLLDIIQALQSMVQVDVDQKNLDFTVEKNNIKNTKIVCDKLRLNQVLINVLSNATKYTKNGGKISFVINELECKKENYAKYEFKVKDNGIGMSREFLKTIFDPFTRVNSSTVSGIQGTGLGMSIAKNLIEMMKGEISIDSRENVGTEVKITFVFKLQNNSDLNENNEIETLVDFHGKKILVVEDKEMNLEITNELLQEEGCITLLARNGEEAVEAVRNAKPGDIDLILMDVQMPLLNGYEATKQIRKLENNELAKLPIIAMTANAFAEDRKEALESGMNEHMAKPINIPELKKLISRFIYN